jgi:hypothetical protein
MALFQFPVIHFRSAQRHGHVDIFLTKESNFSSRLPFWKEMALSRGDLTDARWRIHRPLLPDRGERGPAIEDKRRTVNSIL